MHDIQFRFAEVRDVPLILHFIKMLARYEKLEDQVVAMEALRIKLDAAGERHAETDNKAAVSKGSCFLESFLPKLTPPFFMSTLYVRLPPKTSATCGRNPR